MLKGLQGFQKGNIPWNKNKKGLCVAWNKNLTKETDERVKKKGKDYWSKLENREHSYKALEKAIESNTGRIHSKKWKENQSKGLKGLKKSKEHIEKIRKANIGRKDSIETKKRKSEARKGDKNPNYIDGRSYEPYNKEWTKKLRDKMKKRDKYICQLCGMTEEKQSEKDSLKRGLSVHHIDYDKKNCEEYNLITLCRKCNSFVNFNREDWIRFFRKKIQDNDIV